MLAADKDGTGELGGRSTDRGLRSLGAVTIRLPRLVKPSSPISTEFFMSGAQHPVAADMPNELHGRGVIVGRDGLAWRERWT